jgi:hypothetical protein
MARARKTTVQTYAEFIRAIEGRTVTIDGVSGKICIVHWAGNTAIVHKPDRKGKASAAYHKVKKTNGGTDWDFVLTNSDRLPEIARRAGVEYK